MNTPDLIVIRGAPGVGKSETAKRLAERLGAGARLEVDTLRAMILQVDWTDQRVHVEVLSLAAGLAAGFLRLGCRPVVVVDTFSGDKLVRFLQELQESQPDATVRAFSLVPTWEALSRRLECRSPGGFNNIEVCKSLNADAPRWIIPGEVIIDNSALSPLASVDMILRGCAEDRA